MRATRKLTKAATFAAIKATAPFSPGRATQQQLRFFRRHGMIIQGEPNYLSSKTWLDGTDYSDIRLGNGCTISSYVRILTHDWSPYTVLRGLGREGGHIGKFGAVAVGPYAFVGTGCILMPGASVGACAIVGAGTVVRGFVPPLSIVSGSPAEHRGSVIDYLQRNFASELASLGGDPAHLRDIALQLQQDFEAFIAAE